MKLLQALILFYCSCSLFGQQLKIEKNNSCFYSGHQVILKERLYNLGTEPIVQKMVDTICKFTNIRLKIHIISSNVVNTAAITQQDSIHYLLFDQEFFKSQPYSAVAYALLAHEIAHFVEAHDLSDPARIMEECRADEFMGFVVAQLKHVRELDTFLSTIRNVPFSYDSTIQWKYRERAIRIGWQRGVGLLYGPGFNYESINIEDLPLPSFDKISCLEESAPICRSIFKGCDTLGDVDKLLRQALIKKGYKDVNYFAVSGGYVMTTNIEQFNLDGSSVQGIQRWQDLPPINQLTTWIDYFRDLFRNTGTWYRFFAFRVSNRPTRDTCVKHCIPKTQIPGFLKKSGRWLYEPIAGQFFSNQHHVTISVYQFFVPHNTRKPDENCDPKTLLVSFHLEKSGIMSVLCKD